MSDLNSQNPKIKIPIKWENLDWDDQLDDCYMERCKVIGGWLVMHSKFYYDGRFVDCMAFVPDPAHQWATE